MGFYDDVFCKHALGDDWAVKGGAFQTKMLGPGSAQYTITPEGRLIRHLFRYHWLGKDDPLDTPWMERTPIGEEDTEFHGDILLHGRGHQDERVELVARFTHGTLESLTPFEGLSEARRRTLETLQDPG